MQGVLAVIGALASVVGLAAVFFGIARYFSRREALAVHERNLRKNEELERKLELAEARNSQLSDTLRLGGQAGSTGLELKDRIDRALQEIMAVCGATGGSVYQPIESTHGVSGLSFLTIEPFTRQNRLLKKKIIPLRSMAGRCFQTAVPILHRDVATVADRYGNAAELAEYLPSSSINVPLLHNGDVVAILQLLRREGEEPFSQADLEEVVVAARQLSALAGRIRQFPEVQKAIANGELQESKDASILFFDISSSSLIFREFSTSFGLKLLNEFFEQTCDIGFRFGGSLDNYMGDGALMRFSVPRADDHELSAARAALEMAREFPVIRHYWSEFNPSLSRVHFRAGLSAGPLVEGPVGHSLVRTLGVAGLPITVASSLCAAAPRDRSIVLIDSVMADRLGTGAVTRKFETLGEEKLSAATEAAYELVELA